MLCPLRLDIEPCNVGASPFIDAQLLRDHLKLEAGDDDQLLLAYLLAAVQWAEGATQRTIVARSHALVLGEFGREPIRLPRGKTTAVESVAYSSGGNIVTLRGPSSDGSPEGADYQEDLRGESGGVLMPLRGSAWPSVDTDVPAPIVITYTAGYSKADLPADLKHALMFYVADCYDLRGTPDFDPALLSGGAVRFAARDALISPWRLPRIY